MIPLLLLLSIIQTSYGEQCADISLLNNDDYYPTARFSNTTYNVYNKTLIPIGNACHLLSGYFPPGFIALAYRGECDFVLKAQNALLLNASALIVINNDNEIFPMGGDIDVPIVAIMVDRLSGQQLLDNKYQNTSIILQDCSQIIKDHIYMALLLPALFALVVIMIVFVVSSYHRNRRRDMYIRIPNIRHVEIEEYCEQLNPENDIPNVICVICLEDVVHTNLEKTCYLKCHHSYHKDCITTWFRTKIECPVCKQKY